MQTLATPAPAQTHELTRAELLELTARQAREIVRLSDRNQALTKEITELCRQMVHMQDRLNTHDAFLTAVIGEIEDMPKLEAIHG